MRRAAVLVLVLAACAGEPPPAPAPAEVPSDPGGAPSADPPELPPELGVDGERELLQGPVPAGGAYLRMMEKIAGRVGAGVVRCPLSGGGRANVFRGGPEEHVISWGVLLRLEAPPRPWSVVYEEVFAEDQWLAFLAPVGTTSTVVGTANRAIAYEHPAAEAGKTVACTNVRPAYPREIHGKVANPAPDQELRVVPCLSKPPRVGADGTFAFSMVPPCTFWVEGMGVKSEQVVVEPGSRPLSVEVTLAPNPWEGAGGLTPAGLVAVTDALADLREEDAKTLADIEALEAEFGSAPEVKTLLMNWKSALKGREALAKRTELSLARVPGPSPAP